MRPVPAALDLAQHDLGPGLTAAADAAAAQGRRVAAVLFTNPTNPEGRIYSRQQTRSIIQWCLDRRVHCIRRACWRGCVWETSHATRAGRIVGSHRPCCHAVHTNSDEIYALSVFDEAAAFTSAAVVAQEDISDPDATELAGAAG